MADKTRIVELRTKIATARREEEEQLRFLRVDRHRQREQAQERGEDQAFLDELDRQFTAYEAGTKADYQERIKLWQDQLDTELERFTSA